MSRRLFYTITGRKIYTKDANNEIVEDNKLLTRVAIDLSKVIAVEERLPDANGRFPYGECGLSIYGTEDTSCISIHEPYLEVCQAFEAFLETGYIA